MNYQVTDSGGNFILLAPLGEVQKILGLNAKQIEDLIHTTLILDRKWQLPPSGGRHLWQDRTLFLQRMPLEQAKIFSALEALERHVWMSAGADWGGMHKRAAREARATIISLLQRKAE